MVKKLTFLLLFLLFSCKKSEKIEKKSERAGLVIFVAGEKNFLEREKTLFPLKAGDLLWAGDFLETGSSGRVDVQLSASMAFRISENTRLGIDKLLLSEKGELQDELKLFQGGIYAKIGKGEKNSLFRVSTPTLVASVRGTEFYLETKKDYSQISVTKGKVEVATKEGEKREVFEGEKIETKESGELKQEKLSLQELKKLKDLAEIRIIEPQNFNLLNQNLFEIEKFKEKQIPLNIEDLRKGNLTPLNDTEKLDLKALPEKSKNLLPKSEEKGTAFKPQEFKDSVEEQKKEAETKIDSLKEELPSKKEVQEEVDKRKEELDKLKKKKLF